MKENLNKMGIFNHLLLLGITAFIIINKITRISGKTADVTLVDFRTSYGEDWLGCSRPYATTSKKNFYPDADGSDFVINFVDLLCYQPKMKISLYKPCCGNTLDITYNGETWTTPSCRSATNCYGHLSYEPCDTIDAIIGWHKQVTISITADISDGTCSTAGAEVKMCLACGVPSNVSEWQFTVCKKAVPLPNVTSDNVFDQYKFVNTSQACSYADISNFIPTVTPTLMPTLSPTNVEYKLIAYKQQCYEYNENDYQFIYLSNSTSNITDCANLCEQYRGCKYILYQSVDISSNISNMNRYQRKCVWQILSNNNSNCDITVENKYYDLYQIIRWSEGENDDENNKHNSSVTLPITNCIVVTLVTISCAMLVSLLICYFCIIKAYPSNVSGQLLSFGIIFKGLSIIEKVTILLEIADVVTDFLFWIDVRLLNHYDHGETDTGEIVVCGLLSFAVIGLIWQVLKYLFIRREFSSCDRNGFEKAFVLSLVALIIGLFEDMPQMVLTVIVTNIIESWNIFSELSFSISLASFVWKVLSPILAHYKFISYGSDHHAVASRSPSQSQDVQM